MSLHFYPTSHSSYTIFRHIRGHKRSLYNVLLCKEFITQATQSAGRTLRLFPSNVKVLMAWVAN